MGDFSWSKTQIINFKRNLGTDTLWKLKIILTNKPWLENWIHRRYQLKAGVGLEIDMMVTSSTCNME